MRRAIWLSGLAVLLAAFAWSLAAHPWNWLFAFGLHPYPAGTPWTYQLWSGFVPALTVLGLLGSVISLYHLHNCHRDGCWRVGKHRVDGTPWCNHHVSEARDNQTATLSDVVAQLDRLIGLLEAGGRL